MHGACAVNRPSTERVHVDYSLLVGSVKYCEQRVWVSVCLFVCLFVLSHVKISPILLHVLDLSVVLARSFCDGNAIRYVLPVLWMMTSGFHRASAQNQRRCVCFFAVCSGFVRRIHSVAMGWIMAQSSQK